MGDIAEPDRPDAVPAADLEYDLAHDVPGRREYRPR
jgi:hypothetical protein